MAITITFPLVEPAVAVIELVVEVPVQPEGNVHVYDVAPLTGVTEYVFTAAWHVVVLPVIVPGVTGIELTETANVWATEEPQELLAVTVIFPPIELEVVIMLVVVDVPDHPPGSVQV